MSTTTISIVEQDDIQIISEKEIRYMDGILIGKASDSLSYIDLVQKYLEYDWNKVKSDTIKSIWKGDWAPMKGIEGRKTGMPSMSVSKGKIVEIIHKRMKKTLQHLQAYEEQKQKEHLAREGIAKHVQGYSFTYKFPSGNISIGSFQSGEHARQSRCNIESYIQGESDNLHIFEKLAKGFDPEYMALIKSKLEKARTKNYLLDLTI